MLKLMKYELRKNRTLILVLAGAIVALESLFLISAARKDATWVFASVGLLVFAAYATALGVLTMGVVSYSRELNQKSSYLIFMTPCSPLAIIASKVVFTVLTGLVFAAGLIALAGVDIPIMFKTLDENWEGYVSLIDSYILSDTEWTVASLSMNVALIAISIMLSLVSTICVAYLAITLSATFMRSRKGHALISFLLFVAISFVLGRLEYLLNPRVTVAVTSFMDIGRALLPNLFLSLGTITLTIVLSAWMLSRKVDL